MRNSHIHARGCMTFKVDCMSWGELKRLRAFSRNIIYSKPLMVAHEGSSINNPHLHQRIHRDGD